MTFRYYEIEDSENSDAKIQNIINAANNRNLWLQVDREIFFTRITIKLLTEEDKFIFSLFADHCDEY